ncbi:inositol monophosphatase family protein [Rhizobium binae]|uniref:Fructose-1,6-bisphosphatase/inositol monophosphatase family enzyme n=1 Tax=Rhizobium binae TaxID=1138190 RepID=A0ABV2MP67_9HYPH|nr:inositol monophosphatase family protein [Rhizobium binae]NKL51262.1 inositol monophosphatase [Rhizobium leguminosarum bv. viciae]MBX4927501.1 inositol monophosphatase [Rhizobium binae]MBX4937373.1 inositol monophosphatase [Rhizobium binae]MBX4943454.1 inositol monophosphatase [Rhizobium binae]MBX4953289.1 inositol monophosphatase [Rhizobium binae]
MTATVDVTALADLLRRAAKAEILPRFRRLGRDDVRAKSEATDLVTEADERAERMIKAEAERLWPGALFVGEETVAAEPALLGRLADADLAIVVDPVDGTFNFAAGIPAFGVMASVISGGETIAGIIYDPMGDDWVMAEKGGGAWLRRPDGEARRLRAAEPVALDQMVGMASTGYLPQEKRAEILGNLAKVRFLTNYRCAAHEYRTLAGGHVHYLMYNKLMPWDHLAGTLISQEAGAHAARFDGSAYLPHHLDGGLLVAPDRASWEVLRREVVTV